MLMRNGPQSVSFIERFFPLCLLFRVSIIGSNLYGAYILYVTGLVHM